MTAIRTTARAMLACIFVVDGARQARRTEPVTPSARKVTDRVGPVMQRIHPSLPTDAEALVRADGAVKLVCGLLMLTPARRPAAFVLACSMVPTTLAGHRFWEAADPDTRRRQKEQLMKNLGLTGGLLLAAVDTEGRPGLSWRASHLMSGANRSMHRQARHTRARLRSAARVNSISRRLPSWS